MLKSLKIRNIALISECEIEFDSGLNVLSGETGAGKSVVLDSINFVLGQKADKSMILNGESECSATCVFDISDSEKAKNALSELEIEAEDEIVIKRTFNENGKGNIKLNGETVTASMLRKVTSHLVDVHGQSDHFSLLKETEQLELIDKIDETEIIDLKNDIAKTIAIIKDIRLKLSKLGGSGEERSKRLDYLEFCINEIEKFGLGESEEENLIVKRKKLQNAEKIVTAISTASDVLAGENGASDLLMTAYRQISNLSQFGQEYDKIAEDIDSCVSILQDVNARLSDGLELEFDEREADETEKRLEDISLIKSKYGKTYNDIMNTLFAMKQEFDLISTSSEQIEKLKKSEQIELLNLEKKYSALTEKRKVIAQNISKNLVVRLKELAMKNAKFEVLFESDEIESGLSYNGKDKITFMFSANAGEPLKPLGKVISGGELSRLMLAVKSVTAGANDAHTYIFDEIDAGISGITASVVAENFARIAKERQIIAISHLPQIVAMSDSSKLIKKTEENGITRTNVINLDEKNKSFEVVRLIGGDENSPSAIAHATEMIAKASEFKNKL